MVIKGETATSREEDIDDSEPLPHLVEEMTAQEAFVRQTNSFNRPEAVDQLIDDDVLK